MNLLAFLVLTVAAELLGVRADRMLNEERRQMVAYAGVSRVWWLFMFVLVAVGLAFDRSELQWIGTLAVVAALVLCAGVLIANTRRLARLPLPALYARYR